MRAVILTLVLMLASPAAATDYENIDSLTVGNLVFFGALDRFDYALADTICAKHWVVNRATDSETLLVRGECLGSIAVSEDGCYEDSEGAICDPGPVPAIPCIGNPNSPPYTIAIKPGITVLEETKFTTLSPDFRGDFIQGHAHFVGPWASPSPSIAFTVQYRRHIPTAIRTSSWAQIKALYRR